MKEIITDIFLLRKISEEVSIDEPIDDIIKEMKEIVSRENVLGLAAPQIGYFKRIIVVKIDKNIIPIINPKLTLNFEKIPDLTYEIECCLSLPNEDILVPCENEFDLEFFTEQFAKHKIRVKNKFARVLNHEIRHLDGKLIIDYKK